MAAVGSPWRVVLERALQNNVKLRHAVYMQLATIRPDGRPANRTVVYRGFVEGTDRPTFVTDARSKKMQDFAHSPWAEIAWYFPETREQLRLLGLLTVVTCTSARADEQQARAAAWRALSDPGRLQFGPQAGEPRAPDSTFQQPAPSADDPVSENFCLVFMDVEEVDHVQLTVNERHVFRRRQPGAGDNADYGWEAANVNP